MKYCPKCRIEYPQLTRFCSNCGSLLIELAEEIEEDPAPEESAPELREEEAETAAEQPEEPEAPSAIEPEEDEATVRVRPDPQEQSGSEQRSYYEPQPQQQSYYEQQPQQQAYYEQQPQQPYYEQPYQPEPGQIYAAPPAAPGKPPRVRKKVKAWRRLLCAFLCLFLFLFLLTPALLYSVRRTTGASDGLESLMEDIELSEIPANEIFNDVDEDDDRTLAETLAESAGTPDEALLEDILVEVMDNQRIRTFVAKQASAFLDDIYRGRTRYSFDIDGLIRELKSSRMVNALAGEGVELNDEDYEELAEYIKKQGFEDELSTRTFKSENPDVYNLLHYILGYPALIALLALALAVAILIFAVNRGRIDLSLGDIGGTTLAVGLLLSAFAAFTSFVPDAWLSLCQGKTLIAQIGSSFCMYNLKFYLIIFAVGLVLAIIGAIIRGVKAVEK